MRFDSEVRGIRHRALSGGSVTRHDAEQLCADLLSGQRTWQQTSADAIALVERVDADNRIVNDWLLWLIDVRYEDQRQTEIIHAARQHFREALARYDADRDGWELRYVLRHIVGMWSSFGREKALHTARKHVRHGMLTENELSDFLSQEPGDGSPPPVD